MTVDLISDKVLSKLHGENIRNQITKKVLDIKESFKAIPEEFKEYNRNYALVLKEMWKVEMKKLPRQQGPSRLENMKDIAKEFRLIALNKVAEDWYDRIWLFRSELALITALYELGAIANINEVSESWIPKNYQQLKPVVLRMSGPRKPKNDFKVADIKYSIDKEYLKMMKPLEEWAEISATYVQKLKGINSELTKKKRIANFRPAFLAREHVTVFCQAIAPRQSIQQKKTN